MRWLVTGGLGFIGSHFIQLALRERPRLEIVNLDAMTYAGNLANLRDLQGHPRYQFVKGDICDRIAVRAAVAQGVDAILNFAAETHVDRSIVDPETFLRTDALGTHTLLQALRELAISRYLQVSTDEVYGNVAHGESLESDPLRPRSPYAASKAAGDLLVLAYHATYGAPVLITRGSNTYGPHQYPEKIIPLFVTNLIDDLPVPLYGDGLQIRDWLYVEDHARRDSRHIRKGRTRERLQYLRRDAAHQLGAHAHARATLWAIDGNAHRARRGPSRSRPPLRRQLQQAARAWMESARAIRRRHRSHDRLVSRQRTLVAPVESSACAPVRARRRCVRRIGGPRRVVGAGAWSRVSGATSPKRRRRQSTARSAVRLRTRAA